jgi:HlyD family secretion protein
MPHQIGSRVFSPDCRKAPQRKHARRLRVCSLRPSGLLPTVAYGDEINVTCDGCASGLTARVSFIAKQSEFTPPVIYSLEERGKLVFLIEALPEKPSEFRVGQPVDVTLTHHPPATLPKVAAKPEALR